MDYSYKQILNRVLCKPEELIVVPYFDCKLTDISIEQEGDLIFSMIPNTITSLSYLIENAHDIRVRVSSKNTDLTLLREEYSHKIFRFTTVQMIEEPTPLLFKNPIIFDQREIDEISYILVLGCSKEDVMAKRVEKAIEVFNSSPCNSKTYMIFSGGCPKNGSLGYMTESINMREYAIFRGMPPDRLLVEELSSNTIENLLFSSKIIKLHSNTLDPNITIVTSQYHIKRTEIIALLSLTKLNMHFVGTNELPTKEDMEREHILLCRYIKNR